MQTKMAVVSLICAARREINVCSANPVYEGDADHEGPKRSATRRRTMKTLITALVLALFIAALSFSQAAEAAEAAARKAGRASCQLQQNENCYYRGYPLWQWYSS